MAGTAVLSPHTNSGVSGSSADSVANSGRNSSNIGVGNNGASSSSSRGEACADFLPPFSLAARPEQQQLPFGRVLNFSPGPACLPLEVLQEVQGELLSWHGCGMSVLELNHRGVFFSRLLEEAKGYMQKLLVLPETHQLLFMQGGGTAQFAALPLNWLNSLGDTADYVLTGYWSRYALKEAKKYGEMRVAATSETAAWAALPPVERWTINPNGAYVHYCDNETIGGLEFATAPDLSKAQLLSSAAEGGAPAAGTSAGAAATTPADGELPAAKKRPRGAEDSADLPSSSSSRGDWRWHLVGDMSSNLCSKPIDFEKYGLVYAGAQKNCGVAGVTVVAALKDRLRKDELAVCPSILSYRLCAKADSALNTPPVFNIYVTGLMAKYILQRGGLHAWHSYSSKKAQLLYDVIDDSDGFYEGVVTEKADRSRINICFRVLGASHASEAADYASCSRDSSSSASSSNGVASNSSSNSGTQQHAGLVVDHSGLGVPGPTGPPLSKAQEVGELQPRENKALTKKFLQQAEAAGFFHLGGHRTAGGCRASIYTGMSMDGVERLGRFMKEFAEENANA